MSSSTEASSSSFDSKPFSSASNNEEEPVENLQLRQGVKQSQKLVENSQTRKDVTALRALKRRKPGKKALVAAAEMS
jgi:hypothetical protein